MPGQNGVAGATAPALPQAITLSGLTGAPLSFTMSTLPAGYAVTSVVGPDQKTYDTVAEALAANPNYIVGGNDFKVTISAQEQTGTVHFQYVPGTPGTDTNGKLVTDASGQPAPVTSSTDGTLGLASALPSDITLSGLTNAELPKNLSIPSGAYPGYDVDHVIAPDGQSYDTIAQAQAANPDYQVTANDFTVYLKAQTTTATVKFFADATSGNSIPQDTLDSYGFVFAQGLTGSPISLALLSAPGETSGANAGAGWGSPEANKIDRYINDTIVANLNAALGFTGTSGWVVSEVDDLDGGIHPADHNKTGFEDALNATSYYLGAAENSKTGKANEFDVQLSYSGSLDMEVPAGVDFGNVTVSGKAQVLTGKLEGGLVVTDNRAANQMTPWTVTVSQSPNWGSAGNNGIQEAVQSGTDSAGNPIWLPTGGLSFEGQLMYKGVPLTGANQVSVMTENSPKAGATTVLESNDSSFTLDVPAGLQKPNTNFVGKLQWTLTTAP